MYSYSLTQWLFFFYFYCFFGWCFESTFVSIRKRKFVNRGFMRGPFLPIYGSGAIMMLVVSRPFDDNIILVYLAGCVGATVLEYVTGVTMEALFKVRYWDYSNQKFNFQGHICLSSTLCWGVLTILMTRLVHKPIEGFVLAIKEPYFTVITYMITAVIAVDFVISFKAAMDLRAILIQMEKAKQELVHIQKRLDVIIAVASEDVANYKEELEEHLAQRKEELVENIAQKKDELVEDFAQRRESYEQRKEELAELRQKYILNLELREKYSHFKNAILRNMIRSNPTMSSERFRDALEELKKYVEEKRR